jgi:hypothetical protein
MMQGTKREKLLAALFGGALAIWVLIETAGHMLLQPLSDRQLAVQAATADQATLRGEAAAVEHALRNLKPLVRQSLPADPGRASVLYQGWLLQVLTRHNIDSAIMTPGPAIAELNVGHRIPISVQFTASTSCVAGFLDQFFATPLLHRVTSLNIAPAADGETDEHRVMISIEALSLDSASEAERLPEAATPDPETSLATALARDDIFVPVWPEEPASESVVPHQLTGQPEQIPVVSKAEPAAEHSGLRFVASVWNGQEREAWLVNGATQETRLVVALSDLDVPDAHGPAHPARVMAIGEDYMQVDLQGQHRTFLLGQHLNVQSTGKND